MLTRCIVEVLLTGLSKASGPVNPQCKELLQKSNHQKQEEQNAGQNLEPDTKHLTESEELGKLSEGNVRGEQNLKEEESKREAGGDETWHMEGGKHGENSNPQGPHSFDEAHKEEKEDDGEKRSEDGAYKRKDPSEEGSKEKKHREEAERDLIDKKSHPTAGREAEEDYKHSGEQRYLEGVIHSQEKGNEESKEEDTEEDEEESSERYHHSVHQEYEDSSERGETDIDKRSHKPRHYYRKPRLGSSSEYKKYHKGEKKASLDRSSEEESEFWDKRSHYPRHYYKTGPHFEEKRNSDEIHGSEAMEEKLRSKEFQTRWPHGREYNEEEDMRHHGRENDEKWHHFERKRLPDEPESEVRHHYEERSPHSKASEEDSGKPHTYSGRDEKRPQHGQEQQRSQLEEMLKAQDIEKEGGEQRLYSHEEVPQEDKRRNAYGGEEELEKRRHVEREKHVGNKRTLLMEEGYPRRHYLVENVKRAVAPYIPYYQQLRWKSRNTEKKDEATDPFLEGEEEPSSRLKERDFFPEYSDYDMWEKKPLMDGLHHKHNENNHLERSHQLDVKRQYNRMDELAHLLSYRKKSAEFPEPYSSNEEVKRGHIVRSDEAKLSQRPLTQEEEKELENLAAMDLELQKIAEKFNNNHRG
ncbi:secretogranin-1 [Varanus komodoensis]|uniref:secretogranin-1 n=1 Tax=Varanus komodoensis TaxID=61221 RepID=UPI001CF7E674|nr:secretogranin-1 [Varanus komodoensis]